MFVLVVTVLTVAERVVPMPLPSVFLAHDIRMVETTAVALVFCASAMIVCAIARGAGQPLLIAVSALSMTGGAVAASALVRYLAAPDQSVAPYMVFDPQMPSLATVIAITVFAVSMVYRSAVTALKVRCTVSRIGGLVLMVTTTTALLGHWLGVPWMFFYQPLSSSGMAVPTAIALWWLGAGLLVLPSTRGRVSP